MIVNIGIKLFSSFLVILVIVIIVGFYTLSESQKALEEAVGQGSVFLVEDTIQSIDKSIFLKIEQLERFTSDPLLQSELKKSNQEFEELEDIDAYIAQQDGTRINAAENEFPQFIEDKLTNPLANRLQEVFITFEEKKYGYKTFSEIFVVNKFGALVSATGKTTDYDQSDEVWWENAKNEGFSVSRFEYDASSAVWGISIGVRVTNDEGEFLGVIKAIIPAGIIAREAELTNKKYQTSEIILLTDSKEVVYKTGAFRFLTDMSDEEFVYSISEGSGFFIATHGEREKLFSYTNSKGFQNYEGLGWILLLSHDASEVFAPLNQLYSVLLGVIGISILIIIGLAFVVSHSISVPIKKLTKTTKIIASGDLEQYVEVKSKDEVGQLGDAFNVMTHKLKKSYANLEEKITQRTKELSESNKLKDLFIDIIRHDLLNSAVAVQIGIETALKEKSSKKNETLRFIEKSSNRLINMIENASIFSRLQSDEKINLEKMDLGTILKDVIEGQTSKDSEKGIKIKLDAKDKFFVMANPLIEVVVANLLSNAIKYGSPDSEIVVGINESGSNWRMFVADKGEGIPDKYKKAIFDRFARIEKGPIQGSGLGLAIVKKIVDLHNGKVWVENNFPKGAVFIVELPQSIGDIGNVPKK